VELTHNWSVGGRTRHVKYGSISWEI
jgi:hypothetical protein